MELRKKQELKRAVAHGNHCYLQNHIPKLSRLLLLPPARWSNQKPEGKEAWEMQGQGSDSQNTGQRRVEISEDLGGGRERESENNQQSGDLINMK